MIIVVLGVNHQTAPVEIRERVAFGPDILQQAHQSLLEQRGVRECAILSTCNRTEIYAVIEGSAESDVETALANWLASFHSLGLDSLSPYLFRYREDEAIKHMMRVASGLDSMVLGEPQILGQVKDCWQQASEFKTLGRWLKQLFRHTFTAAKQVRTDTDIGTNPVSVAFAAVDMARHIFSDFSQITVLLIGAGETIELAAKHLKAKGVSKMIIANRTVKRAETLAKEMSAEAIALDALPDYLAKADMVVSSTAAPLPILGKGMVEQALKQRRRQPMFMVDIAVPRDIESQVNELEDVYLYTVDDLREVIQDNLSSRRQAAVQAEEMIGLHVQTFLSWRRSLDAVDTICAYRQEHEQLRDAELKQAMALLAAGADPVKVLSQMANRLTNKFLHQPTLCLRDAAAQQDYELISQLRNIYGIQ
ncbi:glutamyl-tRNA reductase [Pelagibaculum spongiae]|uniref:Glutamyl-tRNA reductase n=1 Tax=Pelagibaculum spongiae TaxID=2080658 RepID=A0A2V1H0I9_9GAMM|nr:glutamyl-tRNA reductase [Pelagibaculum spongiae]PVZ72526.1 glutamyl-tRNA reductase [Pelagibaculum spongiae]